jgi:hypothetical protein
MILKKRICIWIIGLIFVIPVSLHAQEPGGCPALSSGNTYKVALDDITFASPQAINDAQTKLLMDRIKNGLNANLQRIEQETPEKIIVVRCMGRRPVDETDFPQRTVDSLNGFNTLLEVWGSVDLTTGRSTTRESIIGYALIPLLKYQSRANDIAGVIFVKKPGAQIATAPDIFENAKEIRAFVLINLGLKFLRVSKYDAAKDNFCQGIGVLTEIGAAQLPSLHHDLFKYAERLATTTQEQARNDANYRGPLKLAALGSSSCGGH